MQKIVSFLFTVAYPSLVRISTALLLPLLQSLQLDPAQITSVMAKVAAVLKKSPVTFEPMGIYTAPQQEEIVRAIAEGVSTILASFGITESDADIGRLLADVTTKLTVVPVV